MASVLALRQVSAAEPSLGLAPGIGRNLLRTLITLDRVIRIHGGQIARETRDTEG